MRTFDSIEALEVYINALPPPIKLKAAAYRQTRYISHSDFKALEVVQLTFAPYEPDYLYHSKRSNRLYAGNINTAGHGAKFEIRPVTLTQVAKGVDVVALYENWAIALSRNVDLNADYEI